MRRTERKTGKCLDCHAPIFRRAVRCLPCSHVARKGNPSYPRTPEHRRAMSERQKGKKKHYPTGGSIPGVAEKIQAWWTPERRAYAASHRARVQASDPQWRRKIADALFGENNPNYQGKNNASPYGPGWGRRHKREILERDGKQCVECGREKNLDIHHIDHSKTNHDASNLVTLCRSCHKKVHPSR